jgi:hypothetical protein
MAITVHYRWTVTAEMPGKTVALQSVDSNCPMSTFDQT